MKSLQFPHAFVTVAKKNPCRLAEVLFNRISVKPISQQASLL
jgi:hypothetical protein